MTDADARILERLRRDPVVSGARLSADLCVSRAAVWKHIEQLRARGYRIAAARARGYRLIAAPDRLLPGEIGRLLVSTRFGRVIEHHETIASTNTAALERARAGAPEGTLVVAERQTQGRGRLGRRWVSPRSVNFYGSFVLRPTLPPADAPQIALAAALAVARALAPLAPGRIAIKWPNDCLLDGRKVAGILTEMDAELDRVRAVVLGIGVNLNASARAFPAELRSRVTSVRLATGARVDRVAFAAALCAALEAVYDRLLQAGFGALMAEWNTYSCLTGRNVVVECAGRRSAGKVRGLDGHGRLVLAGAAGEEHIVAGDVTLVDGYAGLATRSASR
jgi:BirA family biotin operon repressor/biotin-[acetyl-CoA-carboxylase] ligase